MLYFQIAAAVVSILLGLAQITKETSPMVQKAIEHKQQVDAQKQAERQIAEARRMADEQARMNLQYIYRGNDGTWRYYSDPTNTFWCRVNLDGVQEYARNPQITQIAHNPMVVR